jgi:hypothetical protein
MGGLNLLTFQSYLREQCGGGSELVMLPDFSVRFHKENARFVWLSNAMASMIGWFALTNTSFWPGDGRRRDC